MRVEVGGGGGGGLRGVRYRFVWLDQSDTNNVIKFHAVLPGQPVCQGSWRSYLY